jgi:hypothetical protein
LPLVYNVVSFVFYSSTVNKHGRLSVTLILS